RTRLRRSSHRSGSARRTACVATVPVLLPVRSPQGRPGRSRSWLFHFLVYANPLEAPFVFPGDVRVRLFDRHLGVIAHALSCGDELPQVAKCEAEVARGRDCRPSNRAVVTSRDGFLLVGHPASPSWLVVSVLRTSAGTRTSPSALLRPSRH